MKDPRDVILRPVVSEKSYSALDHGVYTFVVHPDANKTEIKDAVEKIFEKHVVKVNTVTRKGKTKMIRSASGWKEGKRGSQKRAIVTLAPGETIEIFQAK
ncbi:MAG: 50S ribosomal protein L23 [Actinomycetota bacterium]|nr:50S ribosomal protein L23 [Actinomycetota bacterium]